MRNIPGILLDKMGIVYIAWGISDIEAVVEAMHVGEVVTVHDPRTLVYI